MKVRIDYLNNERGKQVRHYMHVVNNLDDCELLGMDIRDLLEQWATDMYIYKL